MQNYYVYRHTSPSGKTYVGITFRNPKVRWGRNGVYYKNSIKFYNAILKYGWDNIKHEILLSNCTKEEAIIFEKLLIAHYKGLNISYNIADGGEGATGVSHSESFCRNQSERLKERWKNNPEPLLNKRTRKGVKQSIEAIRKRSTEVIQFSLDGKYITTYLSTTEAAKSVGVSVKAIRNCCAGGYYCHSRKTWVNVNQSGGFIWKYKNKITTKEKGYD